MTTTIVPRGPRAARLLVLPLIATAALGLTACGGDSAETTAEKAAAGAAQQGYGGYGGPGGGFGAQTEEERAELQACLKKQGVTLPTRGAGGPGGAPGTRTDGAPPAGGDTTARPPAGGGGGALPGGGAPEGGGAPGGGGGAGGMSTAEREKLQAALKSCGVETPTGGGRPQGGARPNVDDAAYRKSIEAYAACVRKNGFDLPDPDFSGDGPIFDPEEVDQTDATFRKASAACQSTLRQGRSSGGSGGSSGSSSSSGGSSS